MVHDVLADEVNDYQVSTQLLAPGDEREVGLRVRMRDSDAAVRRNPLWVAYPRGPLRSGRHLFTLAPGQVGRHQLNLRTTGCHCVSVWFYEHWVIHVAHAPARPDLFVSATPDYDVDDRTHLYGGTTRRSRPPSARVRTQ